MQESLLLPYRNKFPSIPHLPWSSGVSKDDISINNCSVFDGKEVVVSLKMDGENTTAWWNGHIHARSPDSGYHPSRTWCKSFLSSVVQNLPKGWRICGENMYAEHTIHYSNLKSYFYAFAIFDNNNTCLSIDEFIDWCELLNIIHTPILYRGIWNEKLIRSLYSKYYDENKMEGYVVRISDSFNWNNFAFFTAKFVHEDFKKELSEQEYGHWLNKHKMGVIKNELFTKQK